MDSFSFLFAFYGLSFASSCSSVPPDRLRAPILGLVAAELFRTIAAYVTIRIAAPARAIVTTSSQPE